MPEEKTTKSAAKAEKKTTAAKKTAAKTEDAPAKTKPAFIPLCTRNVFSKYYNVHSATSLTHWTLSDATAYRADIESKLEKFLEEKHGTNG